MAKKRLGFEIVGVTSDGKEVVSGVFRVFDTMGLPLDTVFDLCEQHLLSWQSLASLLNLRKVMRGQHGRLPK